MGDLGVVSRGYSGGYRNGRTQPPRDTLGLSGRTPWHSPQRVISGAPVGPVTPAFWPSEKKESRVGSPRHTREGHAEGQPQFQGVQSTPSHLRFAAAHTSSLVGTLVPQTSRAPSGVAVSGLKATFSS